MTIFTGPTGTRRRLASFVVITVFTGCGGAWAQSVGDAESGREQTALVSWQFAKGERDVASVTGGGADDTWQKISLPHTWNDQDGSDGGDNYYRGDAWYRTGFEVSEDLGDRRVFVHVGAANEIADVYVNGEMVGSHAGGYSAFRFDITDHLIDGDNQIAIRVNNAPHGLPPIDADFTFFGGLYRDVKLITVGEAHIDLGDYGGPGVYLDTREMSEDEARVTARVKLTNSAGAEMPSMLVAEVRDASGQVVTEGMAEVAIPAEGGSEETLDLTIPSPRLWQGRADPYLYSVVTRLKGPDGTVLDEVVQPLGIRDFTIDAQDGFYLNGERTPLRGVSYHQDVEDNGFAATLEQKQRDFGIIDELGANAVRLAHYQHSQSVYDLADEYGMVTWAEIPVISEVELSEAYQANAKQQMHELIRQNYNHPSIAVWGVWNEVSLQSDEDVSPLLRDLAEIAQEEDPSRVTTAAVLGRLGPDEPVMNVTETVGQNLYFGWYYGNLTGDLGSWLDELHEAAPDLPIGVSEYGAGAGPAIQSETPSQQDHTEGYQEKYHEEAYLQMKERPWLWSTFVWAMFDFASDQRDEGERAGINDKGLVTRDREDRKDAFYWYQAQWSEEPVLHIAGKRLTERQRGDTTITVYSNLPEAELTLNGEPQGIAEGSDSGRLTWDVVLADGANTVEVRGTGDHSELRDIADWQLLPNDDTVPTSWAASIDGETGRIYNLPSGTTPETLSSVVTLPFGASYDFGDLPADAALEPGDSFDVVAANGDRQSYEIAKGTLSTGRRVQANREARGGGLPDGDARFAVDGDDSFPEAVSDGGYWHPRDVLQIPAWIKVDLGADYYIDELDVAWLDPALSIEGSGTMTYKVGIAPEVERSFAVFNESYEPLFEGHQTDESGRTSDDIGKVGRYLRITVTESDFYMPRNGQAYQNKAITEISAIGGLVHSDALDIDYRDRTIQLGDATPEEARKMIESVGDDTSLEIQGDALVVEAGDGVRREIYTLTRN